MSKDFVPFTAATPGGSRTGGVSRTEVVAGAQSTVPFRPLSQAQPPPPASDARGEPTISLERDGGRVTRIKVRCPCGNVFELACDYSETRSDAAGGGVPGGSGAVPPCQPA